MTTATILRLLGSFIYSSIVINRVLSFRKSNKSSQVKSFPVAHVRSEKAGTIDTMMTQVFIPFLRQAKHSVSQPNATQDSTLPGRNEHGKQHDACMSLYAFSSRFVVVCLYRKPVNQCRRLRHGTKCSQDHTNQNSCWVISSFTTTFFFIDSCIVLVCKTQHVEPRC